MKIDIQCVGMRLTDAIRNHVEDKLGKLERLLPSGVEPVATLHAESESHGGAFLAEVSMRVWGQDIISKSTTDDLYKSVSEVADQLNKQVRRLKDKNKSRVKGAESVRNYEEPAPVMDSLDALDAYDDFAEGVEDAISAEEVLAAKEK